MALSTALKLSKGINEDTANDAGSWEERSQRFLSRASVALASSLDYQTTLVTIANLAVTDFAEWCSVDILTESGELEKVAVTHVDPKRVEWAREYVAKYPTNLNSDSGIARVIRSGESILAREVTEAMIEQFAVNLEQAEEIKQIGVGSAILVPLKARDQILGALTFINSKPGSFGPRDLHLAEDIAQLAALALDNSRLYSSVQRELEERRRAESALRESEARFRELADAMPVMVWVARSKEGVNFTNRYYHSYTGLGPEAKGELGWSAVVHPDDQAAAKASYTAAIEEKAIWQHELRLRRFDGEYRWHLSRAIPTLDENGELVRWYGTSTDIHDQKLLSQDLERRVELRTNALQETVKEAEAFNYAVSHDLRAPLRAIVSTSKILLGELGDRLNTEHRSLLERQANNAIRLGILIDELLRLSRLARVEVVRQTLDMTNLAKSVSAELETNGSCNCQIIIQEGMSGLGDPGLLRTVYLNLIENACKFSPKGGDVTVGYDGESFFVRDQGIGFDMSYVSKIFLPFERLVVESDFPGTGIGLANVERIVRRHGGHVWAVSAPGKGSTFYFNLGG